MAYQPLLLPIRLVPACRAVLSGLMECSITLVSESIVSTVRGWGSAEQGTFFRSLLRRRRPFQVYFQEEGGPFSSRREGGDLLNLKLLGIYYMPYNNHEAFMT